MKTTTVSQTYKGHQIEARLTEDNKPSYVVFIDSVHYSDLSSDNSDDAIENAHIKIDSDEYYKKHKQR